MPTREEVKARFIKEKKEHALFWEFRGKLYFPALPFEYLRELAKPEVSDEELKGWMSEFTREQQLKEAADYIKFAWSKAEGQRGISASRSIEHFEVWFWLAGETEFSQRIKGMACSMYEPYGIPILEEIEKKLKELNIPFKKECPKCYGTFKEKCDNCNKTGEING